MDNIGKYILEYKSNGRVIHLEFSAECNGDELMFELKDFLKACGWTDRQLIKMGFEEYYEN